MFKFLQLTKDGGPESPVEGFYIVEIKKLFSIVLLHFRPGVREAYHTHAFNALSWVLKGRFEEQMLNGTVRVFTPSLKPKKTRRPTFHRVFSAGHTWVLTLRGPWARTWLEYEHGQFTTLTNGRKVLAVNGGGGA